MNDERPTYRKSDPGGGSGDEYRLLVGAVVEYAIFLLDTEGRIASWNPGAERIKGYSRAEIVGESFTRFYPPEDIARGKPARELQIARDLGRYEEEGWRVRKNGEYFWASVLITALRDSTGELRGFGKVTRDLTERREAEEVARELIAEQAARRAAEQGEIALRASERRFRELSARFEATLEGVTDGITVQDREGRIVYANSSAARQCGVDTPEQLINSSGDRVRASFELLDEQGNAFPVAQLPGQRALRGENPEPALLKVREQATGRHWWSIVRARLVRDPDGGGDLVVNIWTDVTSRQRQVEASRYLAMVGAALSNTLAHDDIPQVVVELLVPHFADWCAIDVIEDGKLLPVTVAHKNPDKVALAKRLRERYPEQLDRPQGLGQVMRTGVAELYDEITPAMLDQGATDEEHLEILSGLNIRSAIIAPLRAADRIVGAMTLISAESGRKYDQTDLALAEELGRRSGIALDNARLYRQAQRAILLRDEFLSIAGHELRTPLTALNLQLHGVLLAVERGAALDSTRLSDRLRKAVSQSERLERLIRELLDVARVSSGRMTLEVETFEMAGLLREVIDRHAGELARAGSRAALEIEGDTSGSWDASRLDQVFTNLLENAVKYGQGAPIRVRVVGEPTQVTLTVADGGIGVPEEHRARIFERFERAVSDRNYGGLGLGLWIVREIVRAHGGEVHLAERAEPGATFVVQLPRNAPVSS